jgi:hypothetical protein
VDSLLDDLDPAEMRAVIFAQKFVVIAGHIDQPRALSARAQKLLHYVVMALRPVPAALELPSVHDVADEINRIGAVGPEKIEQSFRLASGRAEMHVGDEQRSDAALPL